jgi:hypothetical protein
VALKIRIAITSWNTIPTGSTTSAAARAEALRRAIFTARYARIAATAVVVDPGIRGFGGG